jgi:hypothetical protein
MSNQSASVLQFIKGQEICQIAFGMYDLQFNWAMVDSRVPDGWFTRLAPEGKSSGPRVTRSMQYQCCVCSSRESNRLMARQKGN